MREAFHEALESILNDLVTMTRLAGRTMADASASLLQADLTKAEEVISESKQLKTMRVALDDNAVDLIARQGPVASDLRLLVTAMQMSTDIERMGELAKHIAKVARLRYPDHAVPESLRATFEEMGQIGERMAEAAAQVIANKDDEGAKNLVLSDDRMDELHASVFQALHSANPTQSHLQTADITLLSRYFERFADHAVNVGRSVSYFVTGEWELMPHEEAVARINRDQS